MNFMDYIAPTTTTVQAPPAPSTLKTLGEAAAPDIQKVDFSHADRSLYCGMRDNTNAPTFAEAGKALLAAQEADGTRSDVSGVDLSRSRIAVDTGRLVLNTERGTFPLRLQAAKQICQQVKAPWAYLKTLPAEKALGALNWSLGTHGKADRTLRLAGDEARALVSDRYGAMDDRTWLRMVFQALREADLLDEARVPTWSTGKVTKMEVNFGDQATGPDGFMLRTGLGFRNGELGNAPASGHGIGFRIVCANSLTRSSKAGAWKRRHVGDPKAQLADLVEAIPGLLNAGKALVEGSYHAMGIELSREAIEARLKRMKLTKAEIARCVEEAAHEVHMRQTHAAYVDRASAEVYAEIADFTAWDMVNGLTAVGRDCNEQRGHELEVLGASILEDILA